MKEIDQNFHLEFKKIQNLFVVKDYLTIISKCKKLIKIYGESIETIHCVAMAYELYGDNDQAIFYFKKIIKNNPNYIPALNNLANIYKKENLFNLAEENYLKIIKQEPNYIAAYVNYANLKRDLNDFEKSIELYKQALKLNYKLPLIHYNLAQAYLNIGNDQLSIKHSNKALEIDNLFTGADKLKSISIKYELGNPHILEMEEKLKNSKLNDFQKIQLFFSLGKAHEDLKKYKESFNFLKQGNTLYKKMIKYNIQKDINLFSSIKENFSNVNYQQYPKNKFDKKIIFVLGMPRSGTTLTEQILSTHEDVCGAGELGLLPKIIKNKFIIDNKVNDSIDFNNLDYSLISDLGKEYMESLKSYNIKEKIIIDKAPLNFRWIGIIKILFPDSKVIHCTRDPKDNCLSIYKNFFESSLEWSYDQKDLGSFYRLYLNLMNFWRNELTDFIYDLNYEKLINNQENETKKLVNFCNLSWNNKFLNHHKNYNPIKTASVSQARQPFYKSSIKSSEKFGVYLPNLFNILES